MPEPGNLQEPSAVSAPACRWQKVWRYPAITIIIIVAIDQLTKYLIITSKTLSTVGGLPMPFSHIQVIPHFFRIVHVRNSGAAWGILGGHTQILTVISLVVFVMILVLYPRFVDGRKERSIAMSLILGGILGNLIDRVAYQNVVDFLCFYLYSLKWQWPSFNVADTCICVGVGIYLISSWKYGDSKRE